MNARKGKNAGSDPWLPRRGIRGALMLAVVFVVAAEGERAAGGISTASPDTIKAMLPAMTFDSFAVRLNGEKVAGKTTTAPDQGDYRSPQTLRSAGCSRWLLSLAFASSCIPICYAPYSRHIKNQARRRHEPYQRGHAAFILSSAQNSRRSGPMQCCQRLDRLLKCQPRQATRVLAHTRLSRGR
jgi:hypothetical protein